MKFLLTFLISLPAYSNTFQLVDTGARFTLKITPVELSYQSEVMTKSFKLSGCSLRLAKELNGELISRIPASEHKNGFKFVIDGKTLTIDPKSELASKALGMDARMMRFILEERKCR